MSITLKFQKRFISVLVLLLIGLFFQNCNNKETSSEYIAINETTAKIPEKIDFVFHVKPILSDRCFTCHGPDKNAVEGGFSLHTAEEAYKALGENLDHYGIVPSDVSKSELVNRIFTKDQGLLMPPPESNLILENYEKEILKKWIEQGAEYKEHWSFVPAKDQVIPKVENSNWVSNEIDNFTLAKMIEKGLSPSEKVNREKLIRRVSFDLTGLPPTPKTIKAFVNDTSNNAYENIIDTLLASNDYAENMALEWMEIARYADTQGYQNDFERTMWPWRDWVIHAFNKNMPFDDFVTYQLAGDLIPNATKEQILATGFNRNHKITGEVGTIPEEYRVEYVEDRMITFGTAFLGLTFDCARCHDHKYDPISQKEHFELFSFFNNIDEKVLMTDPDVIPEPHLMISDKEMDGVLDFIKFENSEVKEIPVMVMKEMKQPRAAFILNRGAYDQRTTQVYANTPSSILEFPEDYPKNRLGLSTWLFNEDNPLTGRVAVNRLWQRMFGNGLVSSPFDFGNQGALPTHPELLDFLTIKYREEGWNTKNMLKYIAMSSTYQQKAHISEESLEKDPENKWLTRAPRLRLSAELIRDQALMISGLLNTKIGGPSVKPYQPAGIWEETTGGAGGSTAKYIQSTGEDLYRKSLYTFWKRTVPPPSMLTFDAATRDRCEVKRQETNTPLQALVLLNDPQFVEAARVIAVNAINSSQDIAEQITYIFEWATSRTPHEDEQSLLIAFYNEMLGKIENKDIIVEDYLSIGEFKVDESLHKEALTALALTAHTILNLDETITRG